MKLSVTVDVRKLKKKMIRWMNLATEHEKASLKRYSALFVDQALRFTPPGNGRIAVSKAHRFLKKRIEHDFMGYDNEAELNSSHFKWYTSPHGVHYATIVKGGSNRSYDSVPPFYVVRGKMTKYSQLALGVGKRGVRYIPHLYKIVGDGLWYYGEYFWYKSKIRSNKGRTMRLAWKGVRHVTTRAALLTEVRRRQFLVGHLAAGWKPIALRAGAKLPSTVSRHPGHGSAKVRHSWRHGAVAEVVNNTSYPHMQKILDRNVPKVREKFAADARKRVKQKMIPALNKP